MWSRQIFVAIVCTFLAWQQVAAVVTSGQSSKVEESNEASAQNAEADKSTKNKDVHSTVVSSEEEANRREASLSIADTYGAPAAVPVDSYFPPSPSNNLPVPVYGVPNAPTNNIVYPEPPPDIPPPISLSYGTPLPNIYGAPLTNSYSPQPSDSYGPPHKKFEGPTLNVPKYLAPGPGRVKPIYGPPRHQYGPPGKPLFSNKFNHKAPFKTNFGGPKYPKPFNTYGPPTGYFKDNYSATKFNSNSNSGNLLSLGHFSQSSHSGASNHFASSVSTHYGVPAIGIQAHLINLDTSGLKDNGITGQYGVPDSGHSFQGSTSVSSQYGVPDGDILGLPKPQYGPPQPSPHPKPPHPGAPAPPTPPDIKYDGWQPIPGLVSRVPSQTYGIPANEHYHIEGDLSYNGDLVPPSVDTHNEHQILAHESVGNLALENSYGVPQQGAKDSYRAPLNIVTGSGGVVSASGEEAHGNHDHHDDNHNIGLSSSVSGQDVQAVRSIGYEIFPNGAGAISSGHSQNIGGYEYSSQSVGGFSSQNVGGYSSQNVGGYNTKLSDSYGAPPLDSYHSSGPYQASHAHSNKELSFSSSVGSSADTHSSYDLFNSHNSHTSQRHKGLSLPSSGIGLIPPSGVYGVPPSGQYGTPLFSGSGHSSSLNALKINPPKYPVHHREPVPSGIFDSITKQASHKYRGHSTQAIYLPPPVSDLPKPGRDYGPPPPSNLYSLPKSHSAVSFQNSNHGSSSTGLQYNLENSDISSYNAHSNVGIDSYNVQGQSHLNVVGLDLSHPGLTIDLTQGHPTQGSYNVVPNDCSLKSQALPSLSYGVPSANSYTASLSSLTTNIGGAYSGTSATASAYGAPEQLPQPQAHTGYEVVEPKPHETYGVPDSSASHSQRINSEVKANLIESESHGKSYGKSVAESFGPNSELIQSQSIDLNNIPLQGALGSYTLQIQSADGGQSQVPHGQVLNDGLLQSILAAIEKPSNGEGLTSQPIIQFQKSLEQQNFVTNDTLSSVVEQLADAEIRHSTKLAKDAIEKTAELSDTEIQHSSPSQQVVDPPTKQNDSSNKNDGNNGEEFDDTTLPLVEDNGIALYFSNSQRSKKETSDEGNSGTNESNAEMAQNSH